MCCSIAINARDYAFCFTASLPFLSRGYRYYLNVTHLSPQRLNDRQLLRIDPIAILLKNKPNRITSLLFYDRSDWIEIGLIVISISLDEIFAWIDPTLIQSDRSGSRSLQPYKRLLVSLRHRHGHNGQRTICQTICDNHH